MAVMLIISNMATSSSGSCFAYDSESVESVDELEIVPQNLPAIVERENRKNIVKTLQGQAEIITNWSLTTRVSDGRQMWMLMDGKPYTYASKFHNNARPAISAVVAGCSRSNMRMGCASLTSRLEDLTTQNTDNMDSDSSSSSTPVTSMSAASSLNVSSITDEWRPLFGGSILEDTSGSGSSLEEKKKKKKKRMYSCGKCEMYLVNKFYWYKHVIKEHGRGEREDVLYDCNYCSKQFGLKKSRDAHQKTHPFWVASNSA